MDDDIEHDERGGHEEHGQEDPLVEIGQERISENIKAQITAKDRIELPKPLREQEANVLIPMPGCLQACQQPGNA